MAKDFAIAFDWEWQRPLRILQAIRNGCLPEAAVEQDGHLFS
jgi:hypothetical protein